MKALKLQEAIWPPKPKCKVLQFPTTTKKVMVVQQPSMACCKTLSLEWDLQRGFI